MQTRNNVHTIRLFDLLAIDGGEHFFESIANSFMSKNADVEQFFCKKAVQATKLNTAATLFMCRHLMHCLDLLSMDG